jgi:hypothetical protein
MTHNERCPACKDTVEKMLKVIYGNVYRNYRINLGTLPGDYAGQPVHASLSSIFSALENYRGFTNFVRARYVDVDFFVPNPGIVIEFDESQHFTEPRKITMGNYPAAKETGYLKDQWISRCSEMKKSDNDPPYRDEQRAWYDTLRDFLPEIKGFKPTVRLYAGEMEWCRLDPKNPADVKKFESIIAEAHIEQSPIEVSCDSNPYLARILIKGAWSGNKDRAKSLLEGVVKKWPSGTRVEYLITPGAFVRFPWPEDFPIPPDNLFPPEKSVDVLRNAAQKICFNLIDERIRQKLSEHVDYLTIGIDSKDNEKNPRYEVELVALIDLKTNQYFWTGKSFPDTPQESRLIRNADLTSHFVNLPKRKVLVLGCHDLKMLSNRGRALAKSEWRKKAHKEIDSLLKSEQPEILLHHPHTTDRYGSWIAEFNELTFRIPSISYISAGLYYNWGNPPRSTFSDVRYNTKRGASIDFIVNLDSGTPEEKPHLLEETKIKTSNVILKSYRPQFAEVIESYKQLAGPAFYSGKTKSSGNYSVKIKKLPTGVNYYFYDCPDSHKIGIELDLNISRAPYLESIIRDLEKIQYDNLPKPKLVLKKTKDGDWLMLQFFYPEDCVPVEIAKGMFGLIDQTYPQISQT